MPVKRGQTIRYPKTRRSPVEHWVTGHTREGTPVRAFTRGRGARSQRPHVVVGATDDDIPIGVHAFTINFKYSDLPDDGESVIVFSDNYPDAIDEAWEEKIDVRIPIAVEAIDPDIGAALEWAGKRVRSAVEYGKPRVKKATELGAKYAVRATMVTGQTVKKVARAGVGASKELLKLTAFGIQKEIIHNLLKLCYQKDKAKRIAARAALKSAIQTYIR